MHYGGLKGDLDTMRAFLDFYLRMLPYVQARTKAQFKNTSAPALTVRTASVCFQLRCQGG